MPQNITMTAVNRIVVLREEIERKERRLAFLANEVTREQAEFDALRAERDAIMAQLPPEVLALMVYDDDIGGPPDSGE